MSTRFLGHHFRHRCTCDFSTHKLSFLSHEMFQLIPKFFTQICSNCRAIFGRCRGNCYIYYGVSSINCHIFRLLKQSSTYQKFERQHVFWSHNIRHRCRMYLTVNCRQLNTFRTIFGQDIVISFLYATIKWQNIPKILILAIFPTPGRKGPVQKNMSFFQFFQSPSVGRKMLTKVCGCVFGIWRRYFDSLDNPDSNLDHVKQL